jgi:hypothetical protein
MTRCGGRFLMRCVDMCRVGAHSLDTLAATEDGMATKTKVQARAEELGAKLTILAESNGRRGELDCEVAAPDGFRFKGTDLHALVGCREDDETKADVWTDLLCRMAEGVEPCADAACDICHDTTDDALTFHGVMVAGARRARTRGLDRSARIDAYVADRACR